MLRVHVLTGVLILVLSSPGWAVPILDQASESGNNLGTLGEPDNAQTFTLGLAGVLSEIEVEVQLNLAGAPDLVIELRNAPGGVPDNDDSLVLASTSVTSSALTLNARTWLSLDLSSLGLAVNVGDTFAISLRVPGSTTPANYFWMVSGATNPYPGGQRWGRSPTWNGGVLGSTWNGTFGTFSPAHDLNFRVFVPEPALAPLAIGASLAAGLAAMRRSSR